MTFWRHFFEKMIFLVEFIIFLEVQPFVWKSSSAQKYFKTCLTILSPQIIHIMQRDRSQAHLRSTFGVDFLSFFGKKMMFPKSIQDHSGMVQGPSKDQKTSKGWQNIDLEASGKFPENDRQTRSYEEFLDLIFSNFPCWRMCCLAAGLEGTIHMTLRADTGSE